MTRLALLIRTLSAVFSDEWSVQLALSSFHDHICLVLFPSSDLQKICSSQHRHWSLQSRVPGCYLSAFSPLGRCHMNSKQLTAVVKIKKKKAFSLISESTSITSLFLQLVHNGHSHAILRDLFWLRLNLISSWKVSIGVLLLHFHIIVLNMSCHFLLVLPIKVQHLEISCSQVACWDHSSEIAFMTTV